MSVEATAAAWAWPGLSSTEKLVLVRIGDHASADGTNAYPGLDRLSRDTGLSRRAIQNAIRSLEQKGALWVTYKTGPHGTNRYTVNLEVPSQPGSTCTVHVVHSASDDRDVASGARDVASDDATPGTSCTQTILNRQEPSVEPSADFETFYRLYPRKVGPDAARRAWKKATKTTNGSVIVAGLQAQLQAHPLMGATDRKFVPHPSTWLNAGRWADEVAPVDEDVYARILRVTGAAS